MEQNLASSRSSRQREAIKNNILNRCDHPTAENVYLAVRETEPRISLATVYRNLDYLVESGLIEKFMVSGEPDHYDSVSDEHYHVRCKYCGEISDVDIQLHDYFARQVKNQTGVNINFLHVIAEGMCNNCKSHIK